MRFCPFCTAENADEAAACTACSRRLPPLPPRRTRNAPPTGIQLPQRKAAPTQPPLPAPVAPLPVPMPGSRLPDRASVPVLPPPPTAVEPRQNLLDALALGPAATRRPPPPLEVRPATDDSRRKTDTVQPGTLDDFATVVDPATAPGVAPTPPTRSRPPSTIPPPTPPPRQPGPFVDPPPTRVHRPESLAERPFAPARVHPIPEIPEPGLINAARYALHFGRARYQRRGAIKLLGGEIKQDTEALDLVLGGLGKVARTVKVDGRVFSAENAAISAAEERIAQLQREHDDVDARKADENTRFIAIESERNAKLTEAERVVDEAQRELAYLEGRRRALRDQRKELERRQKAYLKAAEDSDRQAGTAGMGDTRAELRRAAEHHRKEAAALVKVIESA